MDVDCLWILLQVEKLKNIKRVLCINLSCRIFAQYYSYCGQYPEAIKCIIRSMDYLRQSATDKLLNSTHPTFIHLINDLKKYSKEQSPSER